MKRMKFLCALLLVFSLLGAAARADTYSGTWGISPTSQSGDVQLHMEYHRSDANGDQTWSESDDVPISTFRGLTADDMRTGGHKTFSIVEDAGDFHADGMFSGGQGGGTWSFAPSGSFAAALSSRGIGAPTEKQQFELAVGRFKLATVDTLLRSGFQRPSVDDLVNMVENGVSDNYVNAMKGLRIDPKTVGELIRMRDHGVSANYAADMMRRAPQLNSEDLIELRDHGVSSRYMQALTEAGYGSVQPSQAERLMDHGVSRDYLAGLRQLGYHPSVEDLVRLADHGVSISFIDRMRTHGYTHLTVDDLIRLRDSGF